MEKFNQPDYKKIYEDIISKKYPHKKAECMALLQKQNLSAIDILTLNKKIFRTSIQAENDSQKYRSYSKTDILQMLDYQKKHKLNNSQLANHFKLSRNTVAKWKKMFLV